jgi:ABC transporter, ATP-binding protein sagG
LKLKEELHMSTPVVKVENLVKRYKELIAVDHFNLEIREGEILGLLGPNGSGKTTTINCILSLLSYDKGTIEVFGKEMQPDSYDSKRKIGVVMQNVAVFDALNVYDNIDYFCGLYIKDKQLRRQYVEEAIEFVGLSDYKKFYPKKLSGGLLRRLNIACGIAHKPKLIFLDEPTVAVDPQSRNRILEGILELNRQGATIVYTSHYMEEVEQICTRIAIMDKGKNLATGTTDELKQMIKKKEIISIEILDISDEDILALKELKNVYDVTYENHKLTILCSNGKHNLIHILDYLQTKNLSFGRVYSELPTLNDVFLEMTGKELRD